MGSHLAKYLKVLKYISFDPAILIYELNLKEITRDMHKDLYEKVHYMIIYSSKNTQNI